MLGFAAEGSFDVVVLFFVGVDAGPPGDLHGSWPGIGMVGKPALKGS